MLTRILLTLCFVPLALSKVPPNGIIKQLQNVAEFNKNISQLVLPEINLKEFLQFWESSASNEESGCMQKLSSLVANFGSSDPEKALESLYFFDAAGKPGSGILNGNVIMVGDYDQCLDMKKSSSGYYDSCVVTANAILGGAFPMIVQWTGCLPLECRVGNVSDVETKIYDIFNKYLAKIVYLVPGQASKTCVSTIEWDVGAFVGTSVLSLFCLLVVIGTLWYCTEPVIKSFFQVPSADTQLLVQNDEADYNHNVIEEESLKEEAGERDPTGNMVSVNENTVSCLARLRLFFRCFALQRTLTLLTSTDTKPGQILCLNGIRVLSINWVVLGHTYYLLTFFCADPFYSMTLIKRRNFDLIYNGLPSVDSFFTLSGFLVAYLLLKQLKNGMTSMKWVAYYVHRYIRLTVPYAVVILLEGFMYRIWIHGPLVAWSNGEQSVCKDNWWANILYVNNFYPKSAEEVCIGQTWYLSNDMQFYVLAPLFILLLFKSPLGGLIANAGAIIASMVITAALTYHYNLGPSTVVDVNAGDDFHILYNKPYVRITPYLVGIVGGWVLWKYKQVISKYISSLLLWKRFVLGASLWFITAAVQYAVVFGLHDDIVRFTTEHKALEMAESISYQIFSRFAWGLALTVQILLCQCGLGGFINSLLSWKGWLVLSRLTYGVYLLHFGLMFILLYETRHAFSYSPDYSMAILYLGILTMSYLAAAVLYITIELPVALLESMGYRKQDK